MNIIIMGPQGSGKTTQADLLAKKLYLQHIQTGQIYRQVAKEDSPLGRKIKIVLETGKLVDDQTTLQVVDKHLSEIKTGLAIDGFPRTLVQAQRSLFPVDKVVYLNVSDSQAIQRLTLRGREDDTKELIAERLKLYHRVTEQILDYYRHLGKLIEIDGSGTIEQTQELILQSLNP